MTPRFQTGVLRIAAITPAVLLVCGVARAQTSSGPKPSSRLSIFTNTSRSSGDGVAPATFTELTTAFSYQLPDLDTDGADYGADIRVSSYTAGARATRTSVYEAFVGGRFGNGAVRVRLGHLWLTDLGSLGTVAGGAAEYRTPRAEPTSGRVRVGGFWGFEPNILDTGYATDVRKFGGYVAYDGAGARRHAAGVVIVRNASLTERAVLTTTNFLPVGRKFFLYQSAEYDMTPQAGLGENGLTYFFSTVRVLPTSRLDVQGSYNRGHSIDARGLSEDVLNGRPISTQAATGLLYESIGGRVTYEIAPRVRAYGGYARDKNNRDAAPTGRLTLGGSAANIPRTGLDVTVTDSAYTRPTGRYHSTYVSVGRLLGRRLYLEGDYSTSLSVVRYSRSDGVVVETRPHTSRYDATGTFNVNRTFSLIVTAERTHDDRFVETRIFSGLTYRIQ